MSQRIPASVTTLGEGMQIRRALPTVQRRTIGAWCFLDHFGPTDVSIGRGLRVGPHPHIGLQTVTWLLAGEILHRDSLRNEQLIRPGQLNLMTSGQAIAHSEESPGKSGSGTDLRAGTRRATRVSAGGSGDRDHPEEADPDFLHGVQLWIALPESMRHSPPAFEHHPQLPVIERDGMRTTVVIGEFGGERSAARVHTPLLGLDLEYARACGHVLPLATPFEHGLLVTAGAVVAEGERLEPGTLLYLEPGRDSIAIEGDAGARLFVVGGEPFPEPLLMWWNFVARTRDEITQACRDWNRSAAPFVEVQGYDGPRLAAPLPPWATPG